MGLRLGPGHLTRRCGIVRRWLGVARRGIELRAKESESLTKIVELSAHGVGLLREPGDQIAIDIWRMRCRHDQKDRLPHPQYG